MTEDASSLQEQFRAPARPLGLLTLSWEFMKVGIFAVGETELAMIERAFVQRRGVLTTNDLTEALTYTKPLPGSTVVQIVAYLSYRLGGWPGSALATTCYLLPSALAMAALAAGYVVISEVEVITSAAAGLTAAAVGVLLATAWRLGQRSVNPRQPVSVLLAAGAVVAAGLAGVHVALVVVAAGIVGVAVYRAEEAARQEPS